MILCWKNSPELIVVSQNAKQHDISRVASKRAITRQSLPDVIAGDIRERILDGDLPEGFTIRQEALAEEYDVSRMLVREALKRLDAEGLVQLSNNQGATVTKHSLDEIGEIFDLRILIEVNLFRRAIQAMKTTQIERCEKILEAMEASYDANIAVRLKVNPLQYAIGQPLNIPPEQNGI